MSEDGLQLKTTLLLAEERKCGASWRRYTANQCFGRQVIQRVNSVMLTLPPTWVCSNIKSYCDLTHGMALYKNKGWAKSQASQSKQAYISSDKRLLVSSCKWKLTSWLPISSSLLAGRCSLVCSVLQHWYSEIRK